MGRKAGDVVSGGGSLPWAQGVFGLWLWPDYVHLDLH